MAEEKKQVETPKKIEAAAEKKPQQYAVNNVIRWGNRVARPGQVRDDFLEDDVPWLLEFGHIEKYEEPPPEKEEERVIDITTFSDKEPVVLRVAPQVEEKGGK